MPPKHERMDRQTFTSVLRRGRRIQSAVGSIIISPSPSRHLAAVVSKKVARSAARRNTLRRKLYAALKESVPEGQGVIFIAKVPVMEVSYSALVHLFRDAVAHSSKAR